MTGALVAVSQPNGTMVTDSASPATNPSGPVRRRSTSVHTGRPGMKRVRHASTIERKVEFRRTVRLARHCCASQALRACSVEPQHASKYTIEITWGTISPHHCVTTKRLTSRSCAPTAMVGCTERSSAGLGSTRRASFVEVQNGRTTQGDTARGAYPTWFATKARKGIVHARAKVREQHVDELFFSDLPGQRDREEVLRIHISRMRRDPSKFDVPALAAAAVEFSGAELAQVVIDSLHHAFENGREPTDADMLTAIRSTYPLSRTMPERIQALRRWADGRAVPASKAENSAAGSASARYVWRGMDGGLE